jgi:AmmeMemoRadiSam system protein B
MSTPESLPFPPFDPNAQHQQRPRLVPVRLFPAQAGDQQVLGLADARQVSEKIVFISPAAQMILPLMQGQQTLDEIVVAIGRGLTPEILQTLVAQLDDAGLLFGPTRDSMVQRMRNDFDSLPTLPPASTAAFVEHVAKHHLGAEVSPAQINEVGSTILRQYMDQWMAEALKSVPNPSFDTLPKAIVAPHLDYLRGWMNYASVWGRLRVADRPDRVVVLGTNHFGEATGVTGCDKGYQSPLGTSELDEQLVQILKGKLGPDKSAKLFQNRFDHEREHSIELQIPWIQHCLGGDDWGRYCKVFAATIHDPAANNGESYDGQGLSLKDFVDAMKATIAELPGKTLVVSSADLSHVGPAFGDAKPLAADDPETQAERNKVFAHDRELLQLYSEGKTDEMIASMAWQQNPTRWCSLGNMVAAMQISGGTSAQILNYAAAMDQEGQGMVCSAALVVN